MVSQSLKKVLCLHTQGPALLKTNCMNHKSNIEPFRIKTVEPIKRSTEVERAAFLEAAHFNTSLPHSDHVMIDFFTDSDTSAMPAAQALLGCPTLQLQVWRGPMAVHHSPKAAENNIQLARSSHPS